MALTSGQAPDAVTTGSASSTDLPAWYQSYTQGLAGSASQLASNLNSQPLPGKSVAGFAPDTVDSFNLARSSIGSYQPLMQGAADTLAGVGSATTGMIDYAQGAVGGDAPDWANPGTASKYVNPNINPLIDKANSSVSGPAGSWTDPGVAAKYMSPYTSSVVDNISRLGTRNWEQNILPGIQFAAMGSGNFGSTRNAAQLGQAGVQAANDILGQQSTALQSGYVNAENQFNADANRVQNQGKMQADTALTGAGASNTAYTAGGNLFNNSAQIGQTQQKMQADTALTGAQNLASIMNTNANSMGALAQTNSALQTKDAATLAGIGASEQAQNQAVLDANYTNATAARTDPWTQLGNAKSIVSGIQLPISAVSASSGPASTYNPSAVAGGLSAYSSMMNALSPAQQTQFKALFGQA